METDAARGSHAAADDDAKTAADDDGARAGLAGPAVLGQASGSASAAGWASASGSASAWGSASGCPSALIAIGEERGMWLELLRMHMRAENFREAVRLVECHVKYWKPRVVDGFDTKMRLDVPLLVQLQRALDIVRGEYPDADWLSDKLAQSLDELKSTLMLLSQRMIIANGN